VGSKKVCSKGFKFQSIPSVPLPCDSRKDPLLNRLRGY